MAIKYVCDACGKELAVSERGGVIQLGQNPQDWAVIQVGLPRKHPGFNQVGPFPYEPPINLIVCSQPCAEKALDEAKERLREAFEKVG